MEEWVGRVHRYKLLKIPVCMSTLWRIEDVNVTAYDDAKFEEEEYINDRIIDAGGRCSF